LESRQNILKASFKRSLEGLIFISSNDIVLLEV